MRANLTLGDLLDRAAERFPDRIAIYSDKGHLTYRELRRRVNALANWFLAGGLHKGDRIAGMVKRTPALVISFLAAAKAGGIYCPINYKLAGEQLGFLIESIDPFAIIADQELESQYRSIRDELSPGAAVLWAGDGPSGGEELRKVISSARGVDPIADIDPSDPVYLNYTSGSTGVPKGAVTTHANLMWNTISAIETLGLTPDDIFLGMFAAFSHPHDLFMRALYLGGSIVMLDSINPRTIVRTIATYRVDLMMGVPSMYEIMVPHMRLRRDELGSLRMLELGGAHVTRDLNDNIYRILGARLVPVWGSTETTGIALAMPVDGDYKQGSVGRPCRYYRIKLVDEDGVEVRDGAVGEMLVRGPAVISSYWKNGDALSSTFVDGWYRSGDYFRRAADAYYFFAGRKDNMIKVGGIKVFPLEIENVIASHPGVAEVAVIGAREKLRGEIPRAVIVAGKNPSISAKEIRRYCRGKLAEYKVPRLVDFVEGLPKTGSGKLDRKAINDMFGYRSRP
ncbi:MAG: AMP-binding protein [Candidatus Tritonobacter lacicola]|nr:AMP-binding protein [Candidatus Tritonobacter lacicola]